MLYGIFLTAILQGFLGGIGLAVAGIRNPIFWGNINGFFRHIADRWNRNCLVAGFAFFARQRSLYRRNRTSNMGRAYCRVYR